MFAPPVDTTFTAECQAEYDQLVREGLETSLHYMDLGQPLPPEVREQFYQRFQEFHVKHRALLENPEYVDEPF